MSIKPLKRVRTPTSIISLKETFKEISLKKDNINKIKLDSVDKINDIDINKIFKEIPLDSNDKSSKKDMCEAPPGFNIISSHFSKIKCDDIILNFFNLDLLFILNDSLVSIENTKYSSSILKF